MFTALFSGVPLKTSDFSIKGACCLCFLIKMTGLSLIEDGAYGTKYG
jgi:hypothetical protein